MSEEERKLYQACMDVLEILIELDPDTDSPEGRLLRGLSATVHEYERSKGWGMGDEQDDPLQDG